jgi:dTDP-4-amino-4,6-dideoxygalactose transaminase
MPGFNFRFTDVLASIGLVQLRALPERVARLQEIYTRYSTGLSSIAHVEFIPMNAGEVGPYIEVLAPDRAALSSFLMEKGIETRSFYPDMDTAPYWKVGESLDNSRVFGREGLYLPSGPSLTDDEVDRVLEGVAEFGDRTTKEQRGMNECG